MAVDTTGGAHPRRHSNSAEEADGSTKARECGGYSSPESPTDDHPLALGLKMAVAMFAAFTIARACGFDSPTWSVISAAFLVTNPPIDSFRAAAKKFLAMLVGVALGALGAFAAMVLVNVPALHFALVGLIGGILGTRSPDYLFAAVVATVVTFAASGSGDPLVEVVVQTGCMIAIGCLVGPLVVWAFELARKRIADWDGGAS